MGARVLVTAAGAPGGPCIIKSLKRDPVVEYVVATDIRRDAAGLYLADKHYIVPPASSPDYVDTIEDIVERERIDVVLPLSSLEVLPLAQATKRLEQTGARVLVSDPDTVRICLDKTLTYDYLLKHEDTREIVPKYFLVTSADELEKSLKALGYPEKTVVVKPPRGKGQRGFRIVVGRRHQSVQDFLESKPYDPYIDGATLLELMHGAQQRVDLLVMEYLPGDEYTVDLLCSEEGEPMLVVPRKRVKVALGISVVALVERKEELIDMSSRIARKLKLKYVSNIQFKYDERGRPKLLEVNPRIAGTVCASVEAGVNIPALAVRMALGYELPEIKVRWGTMIVRYWDHVVLQH